MNYTDQISRGKWQRITHIYGNLSNPDFRLRKLLNFYHFYRISHGNGSFTLVCLYQGMNSLKIVFNIGGLYLNHNGTKFEFGDLFALKTYNMLYKICIYNVQCKYKNEKQDIHTVFHYGSAHVKTAQYFYLLHHNPPSSLPYPFMWVDANSNHDISKHKHWFIPMDGSDIHD